MPRRSSTRFQPQPPSSPPPQQSQGSNGGVDDDPLRQLRTNWKWAAFSQFFFTFNHLFAMNNVSLNDIENDLIRGSCIVLPRIMQRLLYTVSYDRKVSLDNWQTALRKQYRKRDPMANPIGPEPQANIPEPWEEEDQHENAAVPDSDEALVENREKNESRQGPSTEPEVQPGTDPESTRASTLERGLSVSIADSKGLSVQPSEIDTRPGTTDGTEREDTQGLPEELQKDVEGQEESKDWLDLPMLVKLDSMHLLTEWQFRNPMRLRTLMRNDDENATWRIEPIGYDSKSNAYWLIGADRLWIQRPIPKPPKPRATAQSLKRKRSTNAAKTPTKPSVKSNSKSKNPQRQRVQVEPSSPRSPHGDRGSRAAKHEANLKLDRQAKELAALNKQAAIFAKEEAGLRGSKRGSLAINKGTGSPPKTMGTRISKRLRGVGKEDEGEWQPIPEEWLNGEHDMKQSKMGVNGKGKRGTSGGKGKERASVEVEEDREDNDEDTKVGKKLKTGLESDGSEISDLTELSELSEERVMDDTANGDDRDQENMQQEGTVTIKEEDMKHVVPAPPADDRGLEEPPVLPVGFIEWETICVTLHEWETIAERFAKATHYTEKALYKVLTNHIVPVVTEELREIQRKHQLSLALTQRKRSSRLLLRQSEKEEAEAAARKAAEEEEKNSRAKRLAARLKKEEEERTRREVSREMRRREREEREEREKEAKEKKEKTEADGSIRDGEENMHVDVVGLQTDPSSSRQYLNKSQYNGATHSNSNGAGSGSRTPIGDDWELDCEICHRRGINLDDGTPMMSCGRCSKWQHIACHDRADHLAGRKRRNWDIVEFFCLQCLSRGIGDPRSINNNNNESQSMIATGQAQKAGQSSYTAHIMPSAVPYNPNQHMGTVDPASYAAQAMANGGGTYGKARQMSHVTSIPPVHPQQRRQVQTQETHAHNQPSASGIAFSHYQPQERGFSSSPSQYNAFGNTQQYGQPHAGIPLNPYSHYSSHNVTTNGSGQAYQARWSVTTPTYTNPNNPSSTTTDRSGSSMQHGQSPVLPQNLQIPGTPWQGSPQAVQHQMVLQQNPSQFRHLSTYQHYPNPFINHPS